MGNTSIKYLQSNVFSLVKLDGGISRNVLDNKRSQEIVSSIAQLTHDLGISVLAEYVETEQQRQVLEDAYTGYGVEYLDMIADYTGWQYEYVMIPEEDRLKALEDGTIDLLCAKKDDTSVFFDDYEAMNGKRIALNSSRSMESMLMDFSVDHQITYTPVYYPTFLSMKVPMIFRVTG